MSKATSRTLRLTAALALLVNAAACNASGGEITTPLFGGCTGPAPDERFVGSWRGQLSGRELRVTLKRECGGLNFQSFWLVTGTWTWGGLSEGTTFAGGSTWWLKGNVNDAGPFRGLTIVIQDGASLDSLSAVATGELPLTRSSSGAWQAIGEDPFILVRQ